MRELDLKPTCGLCKGTGKTSHIGFASAGDMDAGNEPHKIERTCSNCRGKGWTYADREELTEEVLSLRDQLDGKDRIINDALEQAGLLAEVTGRNSKIERSLVATRAWLYRHSQNLEHRQPKGLGRPSPTGTEGWAVAAIPDWDVRQRIAEMDEALEGSLR